MEHIDLTASEQGFIWTTYQTQSLHLCILKYFDQHLEDEHARKLNQKTLNTVLSYLEELKEMMTREGFPIPIGFGDEDVFLHSKKLYTDPFVMYFQWHIAKGNLNFGAVAINTIARDDVHQFFNRFVKDSLELLDEARILLLDKGLWIRSPYIPIPEKIEFVEKQSYLSQWIGEHRPISGQEISVVFYNLLTNQMGFELMKSFLQVCTDNKVLDYIKRGKDISEKHAKEMGQLLNQEELPVPMSWNAGVTDSKEAPFSAKLMINMIGFLNAQGIANYGLALSNSMRTDISSKFAGLATEVAKYAEDGANLLIRNGWFESPPQAPKR